MPQLPDDKLAGLGSAKALALACYGEDMAAYRYLQLSEKAPRETDRKAFRGMVAEEQEHRDRLQALLDAHFSGSEFLLTPEEKQSVESGSRSLQISDQQSFEQAVRMVIESEGVTAQFYHRMAPHVAEPDIRAIFQELAMEGAQHQQRLIEIARQNNIAIP